MRGAQCFLGLLGRKEFLDLFHVLLPHRGSLHRRLSAVRRDLPGGLRLPPTDFGEQRKPRPEQTPQQLEIPASYRNAFLACLLQSLCGRRVFNPSWPSNTRLHLKIVHAPTSMRRLHREVCHQGNKINKQRSVRLQRLQTFHSSLKFSGNPLRSTVAREPERGADFHFYGSWKRELLLCFLQFEQAVDPHRHNRNSRLFASNPTPARKGRILPSFVCLPSGKTRML